MRSPGSTKLLLLLGLVSGFAPRDAPCRGACRRGPRSLAADPDGPDDVDRLLGRVDDLEGRLRRLKDATDLATPAAAQAEKVDATDSVLGAAALAAAGALGAGLDTDVAIAVAGGATVLALGDENSSVSELTRAVGALGVASARSALRFERENNVTGGALGLARASWQRVRAVQRATSEARERRLAAEAKAAAEGAAAAPSPSAPVDDAVVAEKPRADAARKKAAEDAAARKAEAARAQRLLAEETARKRAAAEAARKKAAQDAAARKAEAASAEAAARARAAEETARKRAAAEAAARESATPAAADGVSAARRRADDVAEMLQARTLAAARSQTAVPSEPAPSPAPAGSAELTPPPPKSALRRLFSFPRTGRLLRWLWGIIY